MPIRKSPTSVENVEKKKTTRKAPARKTVEAAVVPLVEKRVPTHDEIAILAVQFWNERGQPYGSAEIDWFRAESTLHAA